MKLRTDGHSLRLRISPTEMKQLKSTGQIEISLPLPNGKSFQYALLTDATANTIEVKMTANRISIHLPKGPAQKWMEDETSEGIYARLPTNQKQALKVAVEKDFPCQHKENDAQNVFTPPNKTKPNQ